MKYRKKSIVIEAVQWNGDNKDELFSFYKDAEINNHGMLIISTLEGDMVASIKDWIIKGIKGEFYPCKPDIFEATYDKVVTTEKTYTYFVSFTCNGEQGRTAFQL